MQILCCVIQRMSTSKEVLPVGNMEPPPSDMEGLLSTECRNNTRESASSLYFLTVRLWPRYLTSGPHLQNGINKIYVRGFSRRLNQNVCRTLSVCLSGL